MGLDKRGKVRWMTFVPEGGQACQLGDSIVAKVKVKIVEGPDVDTSEEKERTFAELMERYIEEQDLGRSARVPAGATRAALAPSLGICSCLQSRQG